MPITKDIPPPTHAPTTQLSEKPTDCLQLDLAPNSKHAAEKVFARLGISPSEAVRMFYAYVEMYEELPFAFHTPNEATLAAINEDTSHAPRYHLESATDFLKSWIPE